MPARDLLVEAEDAQEVVPELAGLPSRTGPERFRTHTTPGREVLLRVDGGKVAGVAFRPADPHLGGAVLLDYAAFGWREDVRLDLLVPSETRTTCAYKGHASYLSHPPAGEAGGTSRGPTPAPLHDALRVRDMVCFFAERTDLTVDGEPQERPVTFWSLRDRAT